MLAPFHVHLTPSHGYSKPLGHFCCTPKFIRLTSALLSMEERPMGECPHDQEPHKPLQSYSSSLPFRSSPFIINISVKTEKTTDENTTTIHTCKIVSYNSLSTSKIPIRCLLNQVDPYILSCASAYLTFHRCFPLLRCL